MKKAVLVLFTFLLAAIEAAVTSDITIGWHTAQILLCAVVALSVFDFKCGVISAVLCGFLTDCLTARTVGISVIMLVAAAVFVKLMSGFMYKKSVITAVTLSVVITFLFEFLQYLFMFLIPGDKHISFALTRLIFPQVFINALCAAVLYFIYRFLWKVMRMEKERWGL